MDHSFDPYVSSAHQSKRLLTARLSHQLGVLRAEMEFVLPQNLTQRLNVCNASAAMESLCRDLILVFPSVG